MASVGSGLKSVAYLLVLREQNPQLLNEFVHSFESLRRFHPELTVLVYHENTTLEQVEYLRSLPGLIDVPIAVDRSGRYRPHCVVQNDGFRFPELFVLASKIDVLLLTPGDTLFLDTDTEVMSSLNEVLVSDMPWMHESEGLLVEHDRDWQDARERVGWDSFGWRGDPDRLLMFNSGSIWVPEVCKTELYKAKLLLWSLMSVDATTRGDNRLDEQYAISIALHEASGYAMREIAPRVDHYWRERYDGSPPRYAERFAPGEYDALEFMADRQESATS